MLIIIRSFILTRQRAALFPVKTRRVISPQNVHGRVGPTSCTLCSCTKSAQTTVAQPENQDLDLEFGGRFGTVIWTKLPQRGSGRGSPGIHWVRGKSANPPEATYAYV